MGAQSSLSSSQLPSRPALKILIRSHRTEFLEQLQRDKGQQSSWDPRLKRLFRREMGKEITKEAGGEAEWRCGHKQHSQQGKRGGWDPSGSGFGVPHQQTG